jgi:uncharacterized glyoxalase superfamily protein PhnB
MSFGPVTPILRIFDETKAREFYLGFLGFEVEFEHRYGDNFPLYMGVTRDGVTLHLSEHHGDGCPGARIRIQTSDVDAFQKELIDKQYKYNRPGIQDTPWKTREVTVLDPFGNQLTFAMALE